MIGRLFQEYSIVPLDDQALMTIYSRNSKVNNFFLPKSLKDLKGFKSIFTVRLVVDINTKV